MTDSHTEISKQIVERREAAASIARQLDEQVKAATSPLIQMLAQVQEPAKQLASAYRASLPATHELERQLNSAATPWVEWSQRINAQCRSIAEQYEALVAPALELRAKVEAASQPILRAAEQMNSWRDSIARATEPYQRWRDSIASAMQPYQHAIRQAGLHWEAANRHVQFMAEQVASAMAVVGQRLERFPERNARTVRILANFGWYMDPDALPHEAEQWANLFENGRETKSHTELCRHFGNRLRAIETRLCRQLPHRAKLIRSAFRAHRQRNYGACIPLLLAQADGVCWDQTQVQLYSRKPQARTKLKASLGIESSSPLRVSFLVALIEDTPITAPPNERRTMKDGLFRHAVMHGESLDYATRRNSFRAISLLNYIAWLLAESRALKQKMRTETQHTGPQ